MASLGRPIVGDLTYGSKRGPQSASDVSLEQRRGVDALAPPQPFKVKLCLISRWGVGRAVPEPGPGLPVSCFSIGILIDSDQRDMVGLQISGGRWELPASFCTAAGWRCWMRPWRLWRFRRRCRRSCGTNWGSSRRSRPKKPLFGRLALFFLGLPWWVFCGKTQQTHHVGRGVPCKKTPKLT